MDDKVKAMVEEFGGSILLGGTVIMFSTAQFVEFFKKVYEVGMERGKNEAV